MAKLLQPLWMLLARATEPEMVGMVEYLKAENQILWSKLPKRECLDFFVVFGERHLRHLLSCWLDYYHRFRPEAKPFRREGALPCDWCFGLR